MKVKYLIVLLFCNLCFSQNGKLTSAYDFLRNESSSRSAALGGSFVSFTQDPNVIFYNPGAATSIDGRQISFGFLKHLLDVNAGFLSYSQYMDDLDGWIGTTVQYFNYGSFDATDDLANSTGSFNAGELALGISYARKKDDNFSYGGTIKIIYSSLAGYSSSALAGDFGVLYSLPEKMLNFGASIINLGSQLKSYAGTSEELPLDIKAGVSKTLEHLPLNINLNFHKLNFSYSNFFERFKNFSVGGEFTLSKYTKFRIGYNNEKRTDLKLNTSTGFAGFSLGLGLLISNYNFDYAFSSLGNIGSIHRINLSTKF